MSNYRTGSIDLDGIEQGWAGLERSIQGELSFRGRPRVYRTGYWNRRPHITIESYPGQGVVVIYDLTGEMHSWTWADKESAWAWSRQQNVHIQEMESGAAR